MIAYRLNPSFSRQPVVYRTAPLACLAAEEKRQARQRKLQKKIRFRKHRAAKKQPVSPVKAVRQAVYHHNALNYSNTHSLRR